MNIPKCPVCGFARWHCSCPKPEEPLAPGETEQHRKLQKTGNWSWVYSIDENFVEHRTLVCNIGCNSDLDLAPLRLPILQINPLPQNDVDLYLRSDIIR